MTVTASGIEPGQRRLNNIQTTGRKYRNVTEPSYEIDRTNDVGIETRDGTTLLADVYRPMADAKFPALVSFSCYPRQIQDLGAPVGFIEAGATDFFVPRGYAQVIANARGTGGSEGTWSMFDKQEWQDIADVIEWAAAQPWCDGTVGMLGISYFACAQLAAAVEHPEHLKAIFAPVVTENLYDIVWHHGVQSSSFLSAWMSAVGVMASKTDKLWDSRKLDLARHVLNTPAIHKKMANFNGEAIVAVLKNVIRTPAAQEPFGRLWQEACVEHPTYDEFWAERDTTAGLAGVDIPVYLGCDWDNVPMHLPATFTTWRALHTQPQCPDGHGRRRRVLLAVGGHALRGVGLVRPPPQGHRHRHHGRRSDPLLPARAPMSGGPRTVGRRPTVRWSEFALRADGSLSRDEGETGSRSYLYLPADSGQPAHMNAPDPPRYAGMADRRAHAANGFRRRHRTSTRRLDHRARCGLDRPCSMTSRRMGPRSR